MSKTAADTFFAGQITAELLLDQETLSETQIRPALREEYSTRKDDS